MLTIRIDDSYVYYRDMHLLKLDRADWIKISVWRMIHCLGENVGVLVDTEGKSIASMSPQQRSWKLQDRRIRRTKKWK